MLKDKWEDKPGTNLPAQTSFSNNMVLQPLQGLSDNVTTLTSPGSNLQDGKPGFPINNQFHQQNNSSETHAGQPIVDSNLQELITFLSANYGPKKTPLQIGTPEYMKLVEILKQGSVDGRGPSVEESSGDSKEIGSCSKDGRTYNVQNVDKSIVGRNNQEKISCSEQLWEGSLQLSSSVTLSAVAFFKSGEKLVGNHWPEFIEVKGKVRLEAFEKYVQGLPRSRNRGLMVASICWNEGSSNNGLNGMKEVAKGYKKSSRVGFAHLLSGTDLYICPRSDPIITILAKYGFFKGMSVLDDKPDSMIGCVVWRKNRPSNPVENTTDVKNSPGLTESQNSPPGFSSKQRAEQKLSPEKTESSQLDKPLTLPLTTTCAEVEPCNLVVKKRPFEDDDLPEFDFGVACGKSKFDLGVACGKSKFDLGVACGKSTVATKPLNSPKKLDNNSSLIQLPSVVNVIERNNNNNGSLKPSSKKTKLFDDDDMPEWQPPELHNQPPPLTTSNFQTLPLHPPLPPGPPPPRAEIHSSFPYLPFQPANSQPPVFVRPPLQQLPPPPPQPPSSTGRFGSNQVLPVTSQPPVFVRPPPQPLPPPPPQPPSSTGRLSSNQVLWHQPPFPPSSGRH
ncbi:uncharacterized protein LOC143556900 isoform X2 [Bidens hawaiensis]|uniref:uncharacterized protein LOC143556900 isoform X2 n=1 Tax=Bidens hawaiensis TaxID=980011 RepID=UPI0040497933